MSKKRPRPDGLLVRVAAELGAGRISEAFIKDASGAQCHGFTEGSRHHITINPVHLTCDTLIHELLHRLYPAWSEAYVRNRTAYLRNRMSDQELQALYGEYQTRVYRPQRPRALDHDD